MPILACANNGQLGGDHLAGVLLALLQNCMLAEAAGTWRIGRELKNAVESIEDPGSRKAATAVLETMLDPNRLKFVDVITGFEDDEESPIGEMLISQSANADLDSIICEKLVPVGSVESTSILAFNQSNFARERSRKACSLIYAPGSKNAREVLTEAFGRVARHCEFIEVYDRQMGISMGGNYHDAIEHWCDFFVSLARGFELRIHTTASQAAATKRKFAEHLAGSAVSLKVFPHLEDEQPHDRFLRACGFTFDIGRGVDLFDRAGDCRDVKIGLSDHGAFTKEWRKLASGQPL
ncbi:MAG: hypothetical protein CFE26_08805 [Verrucomicrobiales bacterium VVV1]|nr:MAG: hypothetical protein CFE26_08805 [Verrucomicrobiales bacterium VVV1]